jgi:Putative zinc-finger
MSGNHISVPLLERYAAGETGEPDLWWAVEAHLESCVDCRDRLAEAVASRSPATAALLERVRVDLAGRLPRNATSPARRRWVPGWAAPAMLPRLVATVLMILAALGLDLVDSTGRFPSLVLLLAPVVPLLPVAAAWSHGLDPAYELVVASPRAGLELVLRRTAAALLVVIPVLAVAGALAGASPASWLLPCLAFTAGALALGEVIGLYRAATGLALAWAVIVVAPSLIRARPPVLLEPAFWPGWAASVAVVVVVMVVRRGAYTGLASTR